MNRSLKKLLWIVGSVVGLIVLSIVLLQIFFPVEKVRSMAVEKASAALNRPITIKDVSLSYLGRTRG